DMAEAYAWGREFQLGYNQHPPFWSWLCGAWFAIFPRADWSFAILSSLNAAIGLVGAWRLVGLFAEGEKRVAATALLLLTPFYTFLSHKYNANSIFLSIWPWTLFYFVRSIEGGRLTDAVLFGVMMAFALLSKYFALVLAASCLFAALQHPRRTRYFLSASPYVSVAVAAAVCAPHISWLATSGAPPLRYLARISDKHISHIAAAAAATLFGALAQNGVVFAVVAFVARPSPGEILPRLKARFAEPRFRFLAILAGAPLILAVAAALALRTNLSTNMLIGTFSLMPLLAIECFGWRRPERLRSVAVRLAGGLTLGALVVSPAVGFAQAWLSHDNNETEPRKELAVEATRLWREATGRPLLYVAGSWEYDNGVAFYSPEQPHVFVDFSTFRNQWVTPQALAAGGLLSVCVTGDDVCLSATAPFVTPQTTRREITLAHDSFGHKGKPVSFVVTMIPPKQG
ncbi:MAG: glycosyltransferase family 39 protein, partial [Hyphomicrobiales bacterium]|nr:glycosyltransferase family 39 protein [Hyphomicrobiales bacterium]